MDRFLPRCRSLRATLLVTQESGLGARALPVMAAWEAAPCPAFREMSRRCGNCTGKTPMSPTDERIPLLKRLRATAFVGFRRRRVGPAVDNKSSYSESLLRVVIDEVERRMATKNTENQSIFSV